jgi:hypothetical protein
VTNKCTILNVLLCDDVRREDNGKDIAIGIYNETMVAETLPILVPTFCIRIMVRTYTTDNLDVSGSISDPDKKDVVQFTGVLKTENTAFLQAFAFRISPIVFSKSGIYKINIGIGQEQSSVSELNVITRQEMQAAISHASPIGSS